MDNTHFKSDYDTEMSRLHDYIAKLETDIEQYRITLRRVLFEAESALVLGDNK